MNIEQNFTILGELAIRLVAIVATVLTAYPLLLGMVVLSQMMASGDPAAYAEMLTR